MDGSSALSSAAYFHSILIFIICAASSARAYSNFYNDIDVTWGDNNVRILNNGDELQLSLTNSSGIMFKNTILIDI